MSYKEEFEEWVKSRFGIKTERDYKQATLTDKYSYLNLMEAYLVGRQKCEEERERLREALSKAVDLIRVWHGEIGWGIYFKDAPEMKEIREALEP